MFRSNANEFSPDSFVILTKCTRDFNAVLSKFQ